MSRQLADRIQQLKILSHQTHIKIAHLCLSILDQPLFDEEQNMTMTHAILGALLFQIAQVISDETDARLYEAFLDRLYKETKEQDNAILNEWWPGFWTIAGYKFPDFARDHCEQFLDYTLTTKRANLAVILVVSQKKSWMESEEER